MKTPNWMKDNVQEHRGDIVAVIGISGFFLLLMLIATWMVNEDFKGFMSDCHATGRTEVECRFAYRMKDSGGDVYYFGG